MIEFFSTIISLSILFFFYISCGQALYKRIKFNSNLFNRSLELVVSLYLGVGLWYMTASFLGLYGYFNKPLISVIITGVCLFGFKTSKNLLKEGFKEIKKDFIDYLPETKLWKIICFLALGLLLAGVFSFCSPVDGDGAAFYMPIAKIMAYSGWLRKLPGYDVFSAVGLVGETQLATLMAFNLESAARMLPWLLFLPITFLLFNFAKVFKLSINATILQLLINVTSSSVIYLFNGGKIDLFSAVIGFTGIYVLYFESQILIAGLLLAIAAVAKLSLFIPLFPMVVMGLIAHDYFTETTSKNKIKEFIKNTSLVGLAFIIVLLPHFLKNQIFFNNPLAPFYGSHISWETTWFSAETVKRIVMTYPFVWFYGNFWGQLGTLSLLILMFLPFYFNKKLRILNKQNFLFYGAISGLIFWLIFRPSFVASRYILAILLCFTPLAASGFDNFVIKNKLNKIKLKIIYVIILIWSLHFIATYGSSLFRPARVLSTLTNKDICAVDGKYCYVAQAISKVAEPSARVLQLNKFTYWLRGDLLQTMKNSNELQLNSGLSSEAVWQAVFERGFTYLYLDYDFHKKEIELLSLENPPNWVKLEKIVEIDNISAYKIVYSGAASP